MNLWFVLNALSWTSLSRITQMQLISVWPSLLLGYQELGYKHIILDLSGLTSIDSIGVGQLFLWYHKMQPHHVKLSIVNPQPRIQEILKETHIVELIPLVSPNMEVANRNSSIL